MTMIKFIAYQRSKYKQRMHIFFFMFEERNKYKTNYRYTL